MSEHVGVDMRADGTRVLHLSREQVACAIHDWVKRAGIKIHGPRTASLKHAKGGARVTVDPSASLVIERVSAAPTEEETKAEEITKPAPYVACPAPLGDRPEWLGWPESEAAILSVGTVEWTKNLGALVERARADGVERYRAKRNESIESTTALREKGVTDEDRALAQGLPDWPEIDAVKNTLVVTLPLGYEPTGVDQEWCKIKALAAAARLIRRAEKEGWWSGVGAINAVCGAPTVSYDQGEWPEEMKALGLAAYQATDAQTTEALNAFVNAANALLVWARRQGAAKSAEEAPARGGTECATTS